MRRSLLALAVVALLAAGCGDDDADTATDDTTSTTVEDTSSTSSTTSGSSDTTSPTGGGELPGDRIDIFPYEGARLAVVGVAADDVLNARAEPDPSAEVVAELEPLATGIHATGHNRQLDDGAIWAEVQLDGETAWVNTAFVSQPGNTEDVTTRLYPDVADRPAADTLVALAEQVAADAAGEGEPEPRVTIVAGPTVGDLGEVTVDVLGYPDDAVFGERLHVFAEQEGGESFRLRTVEATTLCRRGVTTEGLCV